MLRLNCLVALVALCGVASFSGAAGSDPQVEAVRDLIGRYLPATLAGQFKLARIDPDPTTGFDVFTISSSASSSTGSAALEIQLGGSSGVALAKALDVYLRSYCNLTLLTWEGSGLAAGQSLQLHAVPRPQRVVAQVPFRYKDNVCTYSYSYVFWDWERWQREIDWAALRGVNLPLAFTGQEYVWQQVWRQLGLTEAEVGDWLTGPAFLAWQRMGNIQGFMGPLLQGFIEDQRDLQLRILQRMRQFGMTPVLTAFAGHVPAGLLRVFPKANVTRLSDWNGFGETYSCTYFLDPTDPLFQTVGKLFITTQLQVYGPSAQQQPGGGSLPKPWASMNFYNMDLFNENDPPSNSTAYLASTASASFAAMRAGDPQAVWVMQGWLFVNAPWFWRDAQMRAFLGAVPDDRMIVLDLYAEVVPVWNATSSFYGKPFIWCMLHNFGGNSGMYGTMGRVVSGPVAAMRAANSTVVGVGITMEGISQNPVMYDLALDTAWSAAAISPAAWVSAYAQSRYGLRDAQVDQAWQLLRASVYDCTDNHHFHDHSVVVQRPALPLAVQPETWYNTSAVAAALKLLLAGGRASGLQRSALFRYDLVDVARQALRDVSNAQYASLAAAFNASYLPGVVQAGAALLQTLRDMDSVLATDANWMLGPWTAAARAMGNSSSQRAALEENARRQLTMWGPRGSSLHDYASKHWAGLVLTFYVPRWQLFASTLQYCLESGARFNATAFEQSCVDMEEAWITSDDVFPVQPSGADLFQLVDDIIQRHHL